MNQTMRLAISRWIQGFNNPESQVNGLYGRTKFYVACPQTTTLHFQHCGLTQTAGKVSGLRSTEPEAFILFTAWKLLGLSSRDPGYLWVKNCRCLHRPRACVKKGSARVDDMKNSDTATISFGIPPKS
jgi:hypothetical protein